MARDNSHGGLRQYGDGQPVEGRDRGGIAAPIGNAWSVSRPFVWYILIELRSWLESMQWEVLAGWRFVLAFLVACHHLHDFVPSQDALVQFSQPIGAFSAVMGFLLISGFSIAHSLSRNPEGFYRRRLIRIYPVYWLAIAITLLPFLLAATPTIATPFHEKVFTQPSWTNLVGNLLFLQGFLVLPLTANAVTWSLSVEVACYAIAPLLMQLHPKQQAILLSFSAVIFALYPGWTHWSSNLSVLRFGLPWLLLGWAWLLGFMYFFQARRPLAMPVMVGLGCLVLSINREIYDHRQYSMLVYIATALIVAYAAYVPLPRWLARLFSYLGDLSYPLYLLHLPAFLLGQVFGQVQNSILLMGAALILAMVAYHAIDVPVRRYFRCAPQLV